jgi:hypothetical protein
MEQGSSEIDGSVRAGYFPPSRKPIAGALCPHEQEGGEIAFSIPPAQFNEGVARALRHFQEATLNSPPVDQHICSWFGRRRRHSERPSSLLSETTEDRRWRCAPLF